MGRYLAAPGNAPALAAKKQAFYLVWDIIWHNGKSLVNLPLVERKEILNQVLGNSSSVTKIDWIASKGLALWQAVKEHELEGMVKLQWQVCKEEAS
ncbi:hypothetical protein JCM39194_20110 [Desulfotomaculum varum]